MNNTTWKLEEVLDLKKWQELQDSLAQTLELAIITVDYKGVPITKHSNCSRFCAYVRASGNLSEFCQKCDARGGFEAVRIGAPYIYLCHCGILDIAIPITVHKRYMGAIMAGQVRLDSQSNGDELEKILYSPQSTLLKSAELLQMYEEITVMPLSQVQSKVKLLSSLCRYIVEEAIEKNTIMELYNNTLKEKSLVAKETSVSTDMLVKIRKNIDQIVLDSTLSRAGSSNYKCKNTLLLPVFQYIQENKSQMISGKQAAELCHISAGYFGRAFLKETGENFSNYLARQKIEWSKSILLNTDLPVAQISEELGFNEPGYFIKVFKKFEGVTPSAFRKLPE